MWISIEILAFCKGHPCGFQLISLHACKEVTQRIPLKSSVAPLCRMQGFQLKPRGLHRDPDGPVPGRLGPSGSLAFRAFCNGYHCGFQCNSAHFARGTPVDFSGIAPLLL